MEEKMMMLGLREVNSSELQIRGGAKASVFSQVVEKLRNFFEFLAEYLPQLIKGFAAGFTGSSLFS